MNSINFLVLVYSDNEGNTYEQMANDLVECGTLVHPETGDDLELTGYYVL